MNHMRDLIAVLAGPIRIAALGVLSAGLAAGATFVLVDKPGVPATSPSVSMRTAEARPDAVAARPSPPPEAESRTPVPQPAAPTSREPAAPAAEPEDSDESGGDD
ncbi:MAG TPA: hypothetical protein VFB69_05420 [Candidatus Dormibacteraeota bacterium]|nr:hypothetical protein [Candidatus Dormibacteraeota bacterium]